MKRDRGKKDKPKLGSKAKELFAKAESVVETGQQAVEGLKALDRLFSNGMKVIAPFTAGRVESLERENAAMRVALCALLTEANGDVQFRSVQPFPFEVTTHRGHIVVRRTR